MAAIGALDGRARTTMELYQLRTFLTIARTGNLTRAAALLATSQPAVSAQLKALEEELGVPLFVRTARGMELTAAGAQLRAKAEEVSLRAAELLALAGTLSGRPAGSCRVGLNTDAGVLRIPALVRALEAAAPGLRLELVQGTSRTITDDVAAGELAAGFVFGEPERSGLSARVLARLELTLAAPSAWAARLAERPLQGLLAGPWVWPPLDCPFHDAARALARTAGAVGATAGGVTADDEATILRLVAAGVGISLLPAFMVEEARARGEVAAVRSPGARLALSFVWRDGDAAGPRLRPVLEALDDIWPGPDPAGGAAR
jgi:DNA-binding transcriptional LysR family regulator